MTCKLLSALLALAFLSAARLQAGQSDSVNQDHERIVFIGDGITPDGARGDKTGIVVAGKETSFAEQKQFIRLSNDFSPLVEMALGKGTLLLRAVNPYAKVAGTVLVGRSQTKKIQVSTFPAVLKLDDLGSGPLRLGVEINWSNRDGSLRQREVFLATAVGGRLSDDLSRCQVFDEATYWQIAVDTAKRLVIPVTLEVPGKLTIVIDDAGGNRIRNLVSGISFSAGAHEIEWDGRNDFGSSVAPGTYRIRVLTHPGLTRQFLTQFDNGGERMFTPWGTNHSIMTGFAANRDVVFTLSPLTEGGNSLVALTPEGKFIRGFAQIHGTGIQRVCGAADERYLYVFHDGISWSNSRNAYLSLTCYEIATGRVVPLNGKQFNVLHPTNKMAIGGAALHRGELYYSNRETDEIVVLDPATATELRRIACPNPGALASAEDALYAVSGRSLIRLVPNRTVCQLDFEPRGLAVGGGKFYLSGAADSTVKCFDQNGRFDGSLGIPGGDYVGRWQPERLIEPLGLLCAPDGMLWIAENRRAPKRISRWDPSAKKLLYEKYGSPTYGSPSAGFDPENPQRWIADGCLWWVDPERKTARVENIVLPQSGHFGERKMARTYRFVHCDGRTFVIGQGSFSVVSELQSDGTLKDLAMISTPGIFQHSLGLKEKGHPVIREAVHKAFPDVPVTQSRLDERVLMLWVDQNGDGKIAADELEFSPFGSVATVGYWGFQPESLDFQLFYQAPDHSRNILTFKADSFNHCGAPDYSIAKAIETAAPITAELPPGINGFQNNSYSNAAGDVVLNTSPYMLSFDRSGRLNWFYPNLWSGVHGSQKAPLPRSGEIQGQLFALGFTHGVLALMGNHGRVFFLTSDGLYIDELFSDCRVSELNGPGLIGGEPFGGGFNYDKKNKRFLLQGGNSGFRIYEIGGFERMKRSETRLTVSAKQLVAAAELNPVKLQDADKNKTTSLPYGASDRKVAQWSRSGWPISLAARYDKQSLYLKYSVRDDSPWVNHGKVWSSLFKTGDSVDLQLETSRDPKRQIRLLVAPMDDKNVAVRYRFQAGADEAKLNPMDFNSPWRSVRVADVKLLDSVKIQVRRGTGSYQVAVEIPLEDLGLDFATLSGSTLTGDVGVIYGDRAGKIDLARVYWSNQETGLVNDVPGEIMLQPENWGKIRFSKGKNE
jgi:hypothetical protein